MPDDCFVSVQEIVAEGEDLVNDYEWGTQEAEAGVWKREEDVSERKDSKETLTKEGKNYMHIWQMMETVLEKN